MRPSSISTALSGRTLGSTQSIRFAWDRIVFIAAIQATVLRYRCRKSVFPGQSVEFTSLSWRGRRVRRRHRVGPPRSPCADSSCWQTRGRNRRSGSAGILRDYRPSGRSAGNRCRVVIGVAEERDRIAHLARDVAHAVRRRQKSLVGPAMQDVAAVNDVGAVDTGRVDPAAVRQLDR